MHKLVREAVEQAEAEVKSRLRQPAALDKMIPPAARDRLLTALRLGNSVRAACVYAGITRTVLYHCLRFGALVDRSPFAAFAADYHAARAHKRRALAED